jgi:hypothetical protein
MKCRKSRPVPSDQATRLRSDSAEGKSLVAAAACAIDRDAADRARSALLVFTVHGSCGRGVLQRDVDASHAHDAARAVTRTYLYDSVNYAHRTLFLPREMPAPSRTASPSGRRCSGAERLSRSCRVTLARSSGGAVATAEQTRAAQSATLTRAVGYSRLLRAWSRAPTFRANAHSQIDARVHSAPPVAAYPQPRGQRFVPSVRREVKVFGFWLARVAEFRRSEPHKENHDIASAGPRVLGQSRRLDHARSRVLCASRACRRSREGAGAAKASGCRRAGNGSSARG